MIRVSSKDKKLTGELKPQTRFQWEPQ